MLSFVCNGLNKCPYKWSLFDCVSSIVSIFFLMSLPFSARIKTTLLLGSESLFNSVAFLFTISVTSVL